MSGTIDHVQYNTRERPLSTDQNDQQSLIARTLMEALRGLHSRSNLGAGGASPSTSIRNVILAGLEVVPSGTDVSIQPGALLQNSATLAPVPAALDSTYRMGRLTAASLVDMPDPVSNTYYLIEAQVRQQDTSSESRDVLNPSTGVFVATSVVKRRENDVIFQVVAGGASAPAPSGGDWVPLAVVLRPSGAPAVAITDIIDVRFMAADAMATPQEFGAEPDLFQYAVVTAGSSPVAQSDTESANFNQIRVGARIPGIGPAYFDVQGTFNWATSTSLHAAGLVVASQEDNWTFIYLCPWQGLLPVNAYGGAISSRGILVFSSDAPDASGRNQATITLPAPWATGNVAVGDAVCVSAFVPVDAVGAMNPWQQHGRKATMEGEANFETNADSTTATVQLLEFDFADKDGIGGSNAFPTGWFKSLKMAIVQTVAGLAASCSVNYMTQSASSTSDEYRELTTSVTPARWQVDVPVTAEFGTAWKIYSNGGGSVLRTLGVSIQGWEI